MNIFRKNTPDPATMYQPTDDNLTNKQLKISVWLLQHKETFVSIGTFALVLWCIVSVGYSTYYWLEYAIVGYSQDKRLLAESVSLVQPYDRLQPLYSAQPLKISAPEIINSGIDTYDIISTISNPNVRHIAQITFVYTYSGTSTKEHTVAILPNSKQVAVELGIQKIGYPVNPSLRIISTKWRRISVHDIVDVPSFTKERLSIETKDVTYNSANSLSTPTDQLQFTLFNNSAYSFYQVNGYLLIYNASGMVGISPLTIERFMSLEERSFDLRFLYSLSGVQEIEFLPLVNIFDPNSFIKP